ncbi:uncharacterized protein LOC121994743 [Zingiber officinale]|uniref:uncharacterized protein LOC121994743 n=1 Tax=Zingiber officinale TaxID=94328 RepID=UPI001C4AF4E5|nr:uncharacterized protein LOC121994743 [Zingiber officinale]
MGRLEKEFLSFLLFRLADHYARFFLATELGHRRPATTSPDSLSLAGACPSPPTVISYPQPHFLFGISSGVRARAATTASHSRRQASVPIIHLTGGVLRHKGKIMEAVPKIRERSRSCSPRPRFFITLLLQNTFTGMCYVIQ